MAFSQKKRKTSKSPSKIDEDDSSSVLKKPKASDNKVAEGKAKVLKPEANPSSVPKVAFKSFFKSPEKKKNNPYWIRFHYLSEKMICMHFQRARFCNNKTYANHILRKDIMNNSTWLSEINFSDDEFFLYENNVVQKDYPGSKYNKRLYLLNGIYSFDNKQEVIAFVRSIANIIAKNLNNRLTQDSQVSVPPSDDVLLDIKNDGVFADVAGESAACEKLIAVLGDDYDPEDFEDSEKVIYSFFKPGSIPNHIGKLLGCSASDMQDQPIYE